MLVINENSDVYLNLNSSGYEFSKGGISLVVWCHFILRFLVETGHEYVGADMLEPREADIPVLFLVLVVLPLVTYILLGKWSDTAKKKARISMLAQLAAEEASRVEAVSSFDVTPAVLLPPSKTGTYECARCFAPATTRCSRCKSVRYCSGKCQIIHWRQGHKLECQQWQGSSLNRSPSVSLKQFLANDVGDDIFSDLSNDASCTSSDTSQDLAAESKLLELDKRIANKLRKDRLANDEAVKCGFEEGISSGVDAPTLCASTLYTELSSKDAQLGHKLESGNFPSSYVVHRIQDTSSTTCAHVPTAPRNVVHHKLTGEIRNVLKPICYPDIPENFINGCENGTEFTSERVDFQEGGVYTANSDILDSNPSVEDFSVKGSVMYKTPPYILGSTSLLSQKSAEKAAKEHRSQGNERIPYTDNESRASSTNCTKNGVQNCNGISIMGGMKMEGSRKSSKVLKRNLLGLINNYNKNKVLFPYEDLVKFFQCEVRGITPRGLLNCGNSCYANAVMQCLTCTKPLMIYLLRRSHSQACRARDWCLMCELEQHVLMLREGGGPLSPGRILSNMRNIGCRMGGGNQEDAHEFLRLLVMSMQSICLEGQGGEKEVDPKLQETTLVQQIFGGRLKSKVKCLRCHLESERYENIMDLTLEIHGWVESLEDALTQFTAPEDLDGENMYRCGRCAAYVKARKQLSVHEVPNILTIVLKRFQTGKYGKINKCVTFPDMLDMIPFVTGTADNPPLYMLYAVIVHLDTLNASFSGHYVSYVKDLQGSWFKIDDSEVQAVSLNEVMSEGAYMLFYSRSFPRPPRAYTERQSAQASVKHATPKTHKASRHGQHKQNGSWISSENSIGGESGLRPENKRDVNSLSREEIFANSFSMDFSDATSSDWSLFTSSDESSFTTESTRDSFSTVDHGDYADPISSLFGPPYYAAEYAQSNTISCTKSSPCRPQTGFFSERHGFILDSSMPARARGNVHKARNLE